MKNIIVSDRSWISLSSMEIEILNLLSYAPLKEWPITINIGVMTGLNEAFIIDGETKDRLIQADARSTEIIKPILRGRDIGRYGIDFADRWLIGTLPSMKINIDDYPAVKKYLESFRPRIDPIGFRGSRKKTNNQWFETQDSVEYYREFEKPKIVYQEICQGARFSYDESKLFINDSAFLLTSSDSDDLFYLLGFLNSRLGEYAFKTFFTGGGLGKKGVRYKKMFLETLPIPVPKKTEKAEIVKLVLLRLGGDCVDELIDDLFYALVGLSKEQINYVKTHCFRGA